MSILANDKHSIGDLLSNRNPFVIPIHQRAYSWEEEEIHSFCQDIMEISTEYFFGGIVSVHEHSNNVPGRIYRVVDGQQRLATFTILLALLKEAFETVSIEGDQEGDDTTKQTAESLADDLQENYLTFRNTRLKPPVREHRLTLSKVDKEFFKSLINGQPLAEESVSHTRLRKAWRIIKENLITPILKNENDSASGKLDQLQSLKEKALENSVIIHITCDNLDEAYQLFEVLNDRGKELAIGDYLRSSTLEILENNESYQKTVSDSWDEILSKKNSEKFIKVYLSSHVASVKKSNVHRQFQKNFFSNLGTNSELEIMTRIKNMRDMLEVYESISEGIYPYQHSVTLSWEKNRLSLLINHLDHKLCIPFLLALYECGSEYDFKECVLLIEKFVFRYITVSGLRANRLSDIYKKHIISMRKEIKFDLNEFKSDLRELLQAHCNNKLFKDMLSTNLYYKKNSKSIKKIRYFLITLESYFTWYLRYKVDDLQRPKPNMSVNFNIDSVEIEHIYPQNPRIVDATLTEYTNFIGNLTFWSPEDNKSANNNQFSDKKKYYSDSNVAITRKLSEESVWNVDEVIKRGEMYFDMSLLIFSI